MLAIGNLIAFAKVHFRKTTLDVFGIALIIVGVIWASAPPQYQEQCSRNLFHELAGGTMENYELASNHYAYWKPFRADGGSEIELNFLATGLVEVKIYSEEYGSIYHHTSTFFQRTIPISWEDTYHFEIHNGNPSLAILNGEWGASKTETEYYWITRYNPIFPYLELTIFGLGISALALARIGRDQNG